MHKVIERVLAAHIRDDVEITPERAELIAIAAAVAEKRAEVLRKLA